MHTVTGSFILQFFYARGCDYLCIMRILLDCRPLQKAGMSSEVTWFIVTCVKELAARHRVDWLFLLDKVAGGLDLPAEGKQLLRKTLPGRLGDKWWNSRVMPGVARREKIDLVMTGTLQADLPDSGGVKKQRAAGKRDNRLGICSWALTGGGLKLSFGGSDALVSLAPDEKVRFLPMAEREKMKEETAEGREYFFADVTGMAGSKIMILLKAFSLFKKRQLSNMKLVLAGAKVVDKLETYKYREDICIYSEREKGQMEAAYAVIYIPRGKDPGIALLNAWKAGSPVISLGNESGLSGPAQGRGAGEAVLQVKEGDIPGLAEALKSLYKNEGIRNELIVRGSSRVEHLSVKESAATIGKLLGIA
jgi:hypothetical protein